MTEHRQLAAIMFTDIVGKRTECMAQEIPAYAFALRKLAGMTAQGLNKRAARHTIVSFR